MVKAIIISGDGLNCENETKRALEKSGAVADIYHINALVETPTILEQYHIMAIPGGFSFGDEISSGQILALKIRHGLGEAFEKFVKDEKLVIGICNGFQTLAKLGLLPYPLQERAMTLYQNDHKTFIDRWVEMTVEKSVCIWTKNFPAKISLPVRHGEGQVVFKGDTQEKSRIYTQLKEQGQIPLTYNENINGSYQNIAGVCDASGRIFGLMPHPEAAIDKILNPSGEKSLGKSIGQIFFDNGVNYAKEHFNC